MKTEETIKTVEPTSIPPKKHSLWPKILAFLFGLAIFAGVLLYISRDNIPLNRSLAGVLWLSSISFLLSLVAVVFKR